MKFFAGLSALLVGVSTSVRLEDSAAGLLQSLQGEEKYTVQYSKLNAALEITRVGEEELQFQCEISGDDDNWIGIGLTDGTMIGTNAVVIDTSDSGERRFRGIQLERKLNPPGVLKDLSDIYSETSVSAEYLKENGKRTIRFTTSNKFINRDLILSGENKFVIIKGQRSIFSPHLASKDTAEIQTVTFAPAPAPAPADADAGKVTVEYPTVGATLQVEKVGDKLAFTATLNGVEGWVGIGVSEGAMVGTNAVVVDKVGGETRFRQLKLISKNNPVAQEANNVDLENPSLEIKDGKRIVKFTTSKIAEADLNLNGPNQIVIVTSSSFAFGFHGLASETTQLKTVDMSGVKQDKKDDEEGAAPVGNDGIIPLQKWPGGQLQITPVANGQQVKVTVTLPGSTGWVAAGLTEGSMIGSNIVLGLKGNTPEEASIDAKSGPGVKRVGQPNIQDASFQVADGNRVLTFTTSKIAGATIDPKGRATFVVVSGPSDNFDYHGSSKDSTEQRTVDLASGSFGGAEEPSGGANNNLIIAHGFMMAFSFIFFMPLAVLPSVFRRWLPEKLWWTLHRPWQIFNCTMAFVAFILAIVFVDKSGTKHFSSTHMQLGLAVIICTAIQPGLAIAIRHTKFRPQWRVSHILVALFCFFGGLANCYLAFDLDVFQVLSDSIQKSLKNTVYVGTAVTCLSSIPIIGHQFLFYTRENKNPHQMDQHDEGEDGEEVPGMESIDRKPDSAMAMA